MGSQPFFLDGLTVDQMNHTHTVSGMVGLIVP
jgi:hypothetical protein